MSSRKRGHGKGLILAGDSTLLASDPKVGKTTLLIDGSYAKLTGPLALKEARADFAGPFGDLQEAVAPYGTTLVVIHHSGRSRAGGDNAQPSATRTCRWWTPSAAASTTPHHDPTMWAR
jgi:hypothetical protein